MKLAEATARRRHFGRPRYNDGPVASIPRALDAERAERHLTVAVAAHERAIALRVAGRFAPAEKACRRALAGYTAAEGARHPDVANALCELAATLEARDRPTEASGALRRALAILRAPSDDPDLLRLRLQARIALAGLDRARGAYAAADRVYRAVLAEARRRLPPRDPLTVGVLNNLGVLRKAEGRYAEAVVSIARPSACSAAIARRAPRWSTTWAGSPTPGVATPRPSRTPGGRSPCAPRPSESSHPAWAADVAALAAVVESRGRLDEAAALYRQSQAVFRRKLGEAEPGVRVGAGRPGGRRAAARERRARPVAVCAGAADPRTPPRSPPPRRRVDRQQPGRAGKKRTSPGARGGAVPARGRQLRRTRSGCGTRTRCWRAGTCAR